MKRLQSAKRMVLQAEKFKASVSKPKDGEFDQLINYIKDNNNDEFFHATCHIDMNLRKKIKRGEYIELERLLPRDRQQAMTEDKRLELISRNGQTFVAPAESGFKIQGIKRWDQAFRIYAAIYSGANPSRAVEIWQYIHVIHMAASSYIWENIAYYDFTFRQLMHSKPHRSWAKIYNQVWSLAMRDQLVGKGGGQQHGLIGYGGQGSSNARQSTGDWRDNCCWRFNNSRGNKCSKWNCPFDHRCKICRSWSHCSSQCTKKKNYNAGGQSNDSNYASSSYSTNSQ